MSLLGTRNRIYRYLISGGTAAAVSLSVLYFLTDVLGVWYLFSSTVAFACAFFVSFLLQKLWTFKNIHTHDIYRQLLLYFTTALAGLSVNALFMYALVELVNVWYIFAQIISSGVIAAVTFFIYGNVIFHHAQKNKILLATPLYPPDIGGPATYTRLLETELPAQGVFPVVVSFGPVRRLPKIIRHIAYFLHVAFLSVEAKIVYALDPVSVGFPALLVSKITRKRFILRVAGDYAWEQFQQKKQETRNKKQNFVTLEEFQKGKFDWVTELRRKIEHTVARHAEVIIVPSEYLKKIVMQWGVSGDKIKVIYNAFESAVLQETKEEARRKLGINGTVLVSAGRLVPWKGFAALIDVVAELKNEIPDIQLYIAGDGPEKQNLELRIKNYELQNKIFLIGRLSQRELAQYIRAADVFVLNTGYEGFSHQLLEVMSLGTPIITTKAGGNPELVEDQKTGLLVSYNNKEEIKRAILLLIKNQTLRDTMAQRGIEKAGEFTKERAIKELIKNF